MPSDTGPLEGHPCQAEIEAKILALDGTPNDEIAVGRDASGEKLWDVDPELIRAHRMHLFPRDAPPPARSEYEERIAADLAPPVVVLPPGDPLGLNGGEPDDRVWVSTIIGRFGPHGRWVGVGDLLTEEEAGHGLAHGTAVPLPVRRGVIALLCAVMKRVSDLEPLVVDSAELVAEAERRGYEVEQ